MTDTRRRVKLYALNAERQWDDRGTGHVTSSYVDRLKGVSLLVRAESDGTRNTSMIDFCNFCNVSNCFVVVVVKSRFTFVRIQNPTRHSLPEAARNPYCMV